MKRERWQGLLMSLPPVAVVALFIGFPVCAAIAYSLGDFGGPNSVISQLAQNQHQAHSFPGTLAAYKDVVGNHSFQRDLLYTVIITVATVIVVLLLSWVIALFLRLNGGRLAKALSALSVVPLFIPVVIASYAILSFYSPDGFLRTVCHALGWKNGPVLGYTMWAVFLGEIWVNVPFGVLMMSSGLNAVPNNLIEAARDSGASMPRTIFSILVPMNFIPSVIVATFTGIYVLGSFTVPYLTGPSSPNLLGPTMTNYFQAFNQAQQSTVMAVIVFALAAGIGALYVRANIRAAKQSGMVS